MYKVVIADDEKRICNGLRDVVPWDKYGFTVGATCSTGSEVMAQLRARAPDLLVTDIYMDEFTGIDLIRAICSNHWHTKVMLISGYRDVDLALAAIRYGAMGYMLKPIDMTQFTESLVRIRTQLDMEREVPAAQANTSSASFIDQVQDYIRDNLREELSLDSLGERFKISACHLSRLFKQYSGENFIDFLTRCRIDRAMLLLRQPTLSVTEVCALVGYNSPRYFSEAFKRMTGLSPKDFRQGNRLPKVMKLNENE